MALSCFCLVQVSLSKKYGDLSSGDGLPSDERDSAAPNVPRQLQDALKRRMGAASWIPAHPMMVSPEDGQRSHSVSTSPSGSDTGSEDDE